MAEQNPTQMTQMTQMTQIERLDARGRSPLARDATAAWILFGVLALVMLVL